MDGFTVVPHEARYWTLEARIGTSITAAARGPGHHYPCRGDTVDHRTARHVELLVALYDNELGGHRGRYGGRVDRALPWVDPRPGDRTSPKRNVTD